MEMKWYVAKDVDDGEVFGMIRMTEKQAQAASTLVEGVMFTVFEAPVFDSVEGFLTAEWERRKDPA